MKICTLLTGETAAWHILDSIADGKLQVLKDNENMIHFMNFFGHQIARTKNFKESVFQRGDAFSHLGVNGDSLINKNWWFISHMFGSNIGASLYLSRQKDRHSILLNETNLPFVTSDQPIINIHECINEAVFEGPEQADFYYPISPSIAYLIQESEKFPVGLCKVTRTQVEELNMKMARRTYVHLFSNNNESLKSVMKYIERPQSR